MTNDYQATYSYQIMKYKLQITKKQVLVELVRHDKMKDVKK